MSITTTSGCRSCAMATACAAECAVPTTSIPAAWRAPESSSANVRWSSTISTRGAELTVVRASWSGRSRVSVTIVSRSRLTGGVPRRCNDPDPPTAGPPRRTRKERARSSGPTLNARDGRSGALVPRRDAEDRPVGQVQQLVRHRAEDGAAQRALPAGAHDDDPAVVPVRRVDQRLGRLLRQHLDDRPDAGPLGLLDRVRHRPPAHLGERPLVRLELLPHPTGRLDAVDEDQGLVEPRGQRDRHGQRRPGPRRLVVAEDDAHRRSSSTWMRSPAIPGRSCQYRLSLARQTNMSTSPTTKIPTPITSGGPTPSH